MRYVIAYDIADPESAAAAAQLLRRLGARLVLRNLWILHTGSSLAHLEGLLGPGLSIGDQLAILPMPAGVDFVRVVWETSGGIFLICSTPSAKRRSASRSSLPSRSPAR